MKKEFQAHHALKLQISGWSVQDIAETIGLSASETARLLKRQGDELRASNRELAEVNRDLSLSRLDMTVRMSLEAAETMHEAAVEGDVAAAGSLAKSLDTVLKAEDRRSKLLGLDEAKNMTVELREQKVGQSKLAQKLGLTSLATSPEETPARP